MNSAIEGMGVRADGDEGCGALIRTQASVASKPDTAVLGWMLPGLHGQMVCASDSQTQYRGFGSHVSQLVHQKASLVGYRWWLKIMKLKDGVNTQLHFLIWGESRTPVSSKRNADALVIENSKVALPAFSIT